MLTDRDIVCKGLAQDSFDARHATDARCDDLRHPLLPESRRDIRCAIRHLVPAGFCLVLRGSAILDRVGARHPRAGGRSRMDSVRAYSVARRVPIETDRESVDILTTNNARERKRTQSVS